MKLPTAFDGLPRSKPRFIPLMLAKLVSAPPTAGDWLTELKLDGYRALAIRDRHNPRLISRNNNDLSGDYPELLKGLETLSPKRFTLDGEIIVADERGLPSFKALQHLGNDPKSRARLAFYAFDILNFEGRDTTRLPIEQRKSLLETALANPSGPVHLLRGLDTLPKEAINKIQEHGIEGIVFKRANSLYEPGLRSGAWLKYRIGWEQEFVIGGFKYPEGATWTIESLLVGYYNDGKLKYAGKVKSGFPESELLRKFRRMVRSTCPFVNLPTGSSGRWGFGVDAEEMKHCIWVQPKLVCQVAFAEWTRGDQLRHTSFKGMRFDRYAKNVVRERKA